MLDRILKLPRYYILLAFISGILSACTDHGIAPEQQQTPDPPQPTVFFSTDVHPILLANCSYSGCHGTVNPRHEFQVESYATIMADTPTYGRHVIAGDADSSPLYIVISSRFAELGQLLRMPRGADSLSTAQQELIRTWINDGALDN